MSPAHAGLHVDVHDGVGPHALLVHGLLSSRAQWLANTAELARHCRPVVVELLGHGRSARPDEPKPYRPHGYSEAFESLREALGIDRWLVIGQSLGAALTLRYVLDHPERVLGHVFTNSTSALGAGPARGAADARRSAMLQRLRAGDRAVLERIPVHPRHARSLPEPYYTALADDARLLDPRGVALGFEHTVPDASSRSRLASNRVPTLLTIGTRERRFAALAEHAAGAMPRLTTVRLDAGHAVNIEAAAGWNAALRDFCAGLPARA